MICCLCFGFGLFIILLGGGWFRLVLAALVLGFRLLYG